MISRKRSLSTGALIIDIILLFSCFFAAALFAQPLHVLSSKPLIFILVFIQPTVWYFSTHSSGLYTNAGTRLYVEQFSAIFQSVVIQIIANVLFIFVIKEDLYTRNFIVYNALLQMLVVSLRAIIYRKVIKALYKNKITERQLLIIGSGNLAVDFYKTLESNPLFGYTGIALIGDTPFEHEHYLGTLKDLEQVLETGKYEEAVVALDESTDEDIIFIINRCNRYAVHTYFIPEYVRFLSKRFELALIGSYPILSLRREPLEELHWQIAKRILDIIIAFCSLVLIASWLFPVIALLQKIFSPGPVFYTQERVGKNNKNFRCYKFRSMHVTRNSNTFQPVVGNDQRITKFGRFLRKSNLDELPQIFNVLKGEMSIVGPRPHAVNYNQVYEEFVEELRLRNLVKPGITGWAQVNGLRGDVPDQLENRKRIKKRIEFDIWYIENWSFFLDFQIIFMTFWHMLSGKTKGL